ncbi:flagellar biosynthetic protein FliO [Microbacterium sp. p3-SID336]|uniref:FliO/MopB family protein n=1 Tax=Microbacterium sp. p3-SID336 TaxID=2916212 RepID=UPI0021A404F7|nr:flagellar biosynthetic protein FliO [Microbacterium sp. p3-SID336]MCT1477825.1 flagellar biosynthetic protein FliO [Microbacterium sp. p3-SID336]
MLGLLWFLQRRVAKTQARKRDAEPITVLGRQGIGPKAQLVVVQTDDARYVLGVTEHGVSVVDRLPVRAEPSVAGGASSAMAQRDADAAEFDRILAAAAFTGALGTTGTTGTPGAPALTDTPGTSAHAGTSSLTGTPASAIPGASTDGTALRRRVRHRNDPLRGSILSPDTWRQTAEALRRAR